jgi:hypothetical protein
METIGHPRRTTPGNLPGPDDPEVKQIARRASFFAVVQYRLLLERRGSIKKKQPLTRPQAHRLAEIVNAMLRRESGRVRRTLRQATQHLE